LKVEGKIGESPPRTSLRSFDKNSQETFEMIFEWKAAIELTSINYQLNSAFGTGKRGTGNDFELLIIK